MAAESWRQPPSGSGKAGKRVWKMAVEQCDELDQELTNIERLILEQAADEADLITEMKAEIAKSGIVIEGRYGLTVHGAKRELRQSRETLSRLLRSINLPNAEGKPESEATRRARKAANARWEEQQRKRGAP